MEHLVALASLNGTRYAQGRAVGRSENPGVPIVIRWALSIPLVEIGLTDLPKSGGATPRDDTIAELNTFPRTPYTLKIQS